MKDLILNKLPENSTSEPYYDLFDGGYLSPKDFTDDSESIKVIEDALHVIRRLVSYLEENDLVE